MLVLSVLPVLSVQTPLFRVPPAQPVHRVLSAPRDQLDQPALKVSPVMSEVSDLRVLLARLVLSATLALLVPLVQTLQLLDPPALLVQTARLVLLVRPVRPVRLVRTQLFRVPLVRLVRRMSPGLAALRRSRHRWLGTAITSTLISLPLKPMR